MRIEFPAKVRIAVNPESGELFVLQDRKEIEQSAEIARKDFEEALEAQVITLESRSVDQVKIESLKKQETDAFEARQAAHLKRLHAEIDEVEKSGVVKTYGYSLLRPTHGQREAILEQCAALNPDIGANQFDGVMYRKLLLRVEGTVKLDGVALAVKEVNDLDPEIANELSKRLHRALHPDPKRMLFTKPE